MRPWTLKDWRLHLWKKGLLPEQRKLLPAVRRKRALPKAKSITVRKRAPAKAPGTGALAMAPSPGRIVVDLLWGDGVGVWHIVLALSVAMRGTVLSRHEAVAAPLPAVSPAPLPGPSEFDRYMTRAASRSLELTGGKSSVLFLMLSTAG